MVKNDVPESITMVSFLRSRFDYVGSSTNATRPDNLPVKVCAICGVSGVSVAPQAYLTRPECCEPIIVCRACGKNTMTVRVKFRELHRECPLHCQSRYAEVEYIKTKKK